MALFNYATKEITIKIVYYGPGLSGKTTNLQYLHSRFDPLKRGKLLSLATEADRTLFFDFLPVEIGKISDFSIRFQLYTVPGQVRYNATRKLVLKGADAIVFIADSQREMREQNIDSLKNMRENLIANNINPDDIPVLLQYNKRDLTDILSPDELNRDLNGNGKYDYREAVAVKGTGVEDSFQHITRLVIRNITQKHRIKIQAPEEKEGTQAVNIPREETVVNATYQEEPVSAEPVFETSRYETAELPLKHSTDEMPASTKKPVGQMFSEESFQQPVKQESALHEETVIKEIKEIREIPVIPAEKLDALINGITEMVQAVKELNALVSGIHTELKDIRKEQKGTSSLLRDITGNIENLKEKKSWFKFS
jgi:mutual gliding-motility protein MglA